MLGLDCYTLTMDDEVTFQAVEAISRFHLRKERTDTHSSNRELFVWIICPKGDCQTPGHLRRLWNALSPDNLDSPHSPFGQVLACTFLRKCQNISDVCNHVQSAWLTGPYKSSYQITSQMEFLILDQGCWTTGTTFWFRCYFGWIFRDSQKLPLTLFCQRMLQMSSKNCTFAFFTH